MFRVLGTLGLAGVVFILWRGRSSVRMTTLGNAWWWLAVAVGLWAIAWLVNVLLRLVDVAIADLLWYAVAVAIVCPFIAVLGARRPTTRVWAAFVLVPLLLVLSLPAVTAWNPDGTVDPLLLEAPALLGFGLVLLMGVGNYFATRFSIPALFTAVSVLQLVLPLSTIGESLRAWIEPLRITATLCLTLAAYRAWWHAARATQASSPFDRLWLDFRDFYGIVWARRIQDRVNASAETEAWPVRLEAVGFVPADRDREIETREETSQPMEQTIRWLLRRFVDSAWIDERLSPESSGSRPESDP